MMKLISSGLLGRHDYVEKSSEGGYNDHQLMNENCIIGYKLNLNISVLGLFVHLCLPCSQS